MKTTTVFTTILILVLGLAGSASGELVAHYEFEGNANDSSGNGLNGTAYGGPSYVGGALGKAIGLDGLDDYVDCGTFNPSEATGQLSVCLWAKWDGLNGQWQGLVAKRDTWAADDMMWQLEAHIDTGALDFKREGSYWDSGSPVLPVGEWAHVAATFDGTTCILYVDGTQTGSGSFSLGSDTEAHVIIGATQPGGALPFDGDLDDVRMYDHVLSAADIGLLMEPPEAPNDVNGFTYQGRLLDADNPADGLYDFQFELYDAPALGTQQGYTIDVNDVDVIDGYFAVKLSFGSEVFDGNHRWLQIGVRPGELEDPNEYTVLSPLQQLTRTPYAIYAETAGEVMTGAGDADNDWKVVGKNMFAMPTGNVGIGTTTPDAKLEVDGQVKITGGSPGVGKVLTSDAAGLASWQTPSSGGSDNDWAISGDDMYAMASGNVGIGTGSPGAKLDVRGNAFVTGPLRVGAPASGSALSVGGSFDLVKNGGVLYAGLLDTDPDAFLEISASGISDDYLMLSSQDGLDGDVLIVNSTGNVGIGTNSPAAKLDVRGTLNVGVDGAGHDVTFFGNDSGSKMFWDESKMALRAGIATSQWDDVNVGKYSTAMGRGTTASSWTSTAIGEYTTASGQASTAMGWDTTASGNGSTAMGKGTTASQYASTAMGDVTIASGVASTAMGYSTTASGNYSTAMGRDTTASGLDSTAIGSVTTASGNYSTAIGQYVTAGPAVNTIAIGKGLGDGSRLVNNIANSLMVGFGSTKPTLFVDGSSVGIGTTTPEFKLTMDNDGGIIAKGTYDSGADLGVSGAGTRLVWYPKNAAFRAGGVSGTEWDNANIGKYSAAMGRSTTASGSCSTAMGSHTTASGNYSTAMGYGTTASEAYSTAMGIWTSASGSSSTAMGSRATATGDYSTAMGFYTTASGDYSTAIGQYVTAGPAVNTIAIGKGLGDGSRLVNNIANSLMVGFGSTDPTLFVSGSSVGIGTTTPSWFKLYVNGPLAVNSDTANKIGGGMWGLLCDARLKEVTGEFDYGLEKILQLNPVRYRYKEDNELGASAEKEYIGFTAQDVQKVIPEAVREGNHGYLILESDAILWTMLNAIKELEGQNRELKAENESLRGQLQSQNQSFEGRFEALERMVWRQQSASAKEVQE